MRKFRDANSTRLILRDSDFDAPFARFVAEWKRNESRPTLDQLIILARLHKLDLAAVGEVAPACQRSHREAQEVVRGLLTKRLPARRGSIEAPVFTLTSSLQDRLGGAEATIREEQVERVLAFVQERGSITNRECQELCQFNRYQAKCLLQWLVQQEDSGLAGKPE